MPASVASGTGPAVVVVVEADDNRAIVARELTNRYTADYSVYVESSASAALERLDALGVAGDDVALVLAEQWMEEMTGATLLARAHDLHPLARRGLLITWGQPPDRRQAVLQACALGQADYYLAWPEQPSDERFHRGMVEFLDEWWRLHGRPTETIRVVAEAHSARAHEMRDLLQRHELAYGFYDCDSEAGQAILAQAGVAGEHRPVVVMYDGRVLVDPSNRDVAAALGVTVRPMDTTYDVTIVGAGPAGLAAAVYAGSEGLSTALIEREAIGGQAGTSSMIRNYLGFPRGISGAELAGRAAEQAQLFGAEIVYGCTATALRAEGNRRVVTLSDRSEVASRAVVIATGVSYRRLPVPALDALIGAGVFYGAGLSEAPALAGQPVFVVGGGNSAGQAAIHLAKYAAHVSILVRSQSLAESMSQYLINDIDTTPNIDIRYATEVVGAGGVGHLEWLELADRSGMTETVPAGALFVLIGAQPFTDWLPSSVVRDQWGYVLTGARCGVASCDMANCGMHADPAGTEEHPHQRAPLLLETTLTGVFAVGDVRQGSIKRVASAAGEGSICIRLVHEYLALPALAPITGAV